MIIHATVVGTKVANPEKDQRDKILNECKKGELLMLEWERDSPYDKNAIAVMRLTRERLGYVSHDEAVGLVRLIDKEQKDFDGVIESVKKPRAGFLGTLFGSKNNPPEIHIVISEKPK